MHRRALILLPLGLVPVFAGSKSPWKSDPNHWTQADAERILYDSPWAQPAQATFPDPRDHDPIPASALPGAGEAGMRSGRGASDGRWDGGVGVNNGGGLPALPVVVRWESAAPVHQAYLRLQALSGQKAPAVDDRDYIVSISGLVPPARTSAKPELTQSSTSDDGTVSSATAAENLLENFMTNSYLQLRSGTIIRPHNAQVDATTGAIRLFFPRTPTITLKEKEVLVRTRYGAFVVRKRFRLSDLAQSGKLEL